MNWILFCMVVATTYFTLLLYNFYNKNLPKLIKRFNWYIYDCKTINVAKYYSLSGKPVEFQTRQYIIKKSFLNTWYLYIKKKENDTYIIEWLPSINGATYYTNYYEAFDILYMMNDHPEKFLEENKFY